MTAFPYLGQLFSLLAAAGWAVAVVLFKKSGETVHPLALNLFKTALAVALLVPTLWLWGGEILRSVPESDYVLLLLSGVLGIGISDTLFFMCLNALGAGLTAIVDTLYSPFIIGLSMLWLGERLTVWQVSGVVLIISAVVAATYDPGNRNAPEKRRLLAGLLYGVLALLLVAVGIVMIKPLLNRSPVLWATEVRLIGGLFFLITFVWGHPRRRLILTTLRAPGSWRFVISGSLMGSYVAMVFWIAGMKLAPASVAAALNQTSTIFIYILAVLFLREPLTFRRTVGVFLAVAGSLLVTFG